MNAPPIERQPFLNTLEACVQRARDAGVETGLVLVDLANLRQINHRHSYRLGDALINETVSTLAAMTVRDNCVFRIDGHRFALIVPDLQNPALLVMALNRVRHSLDDALHLDRELTQAKIVIGLAVTHAKAPGALPLLANAEMHLAAIRAGKEVDLDAVLTQGFQAGGADEFEHAFEEALQNNEFLLAYQPQICARDGRVVGAEALLRWRHPEYGLIAPERVMKMAENRGLLLELTKSLAHGAARQIRHWRDAAFHVPVALNIPAELVSQAELPGMLSAALKIWGIPPSALTVEITEQALVEDLESNTTMLARLRATGLRISIDDFGTGYSSLSYFRNIPADELKIDRSFIARLLLSSQDRELVRIIIEIAHLFNMQVVAEGVEEGDALRALQELGCDIIQGFGVARPMPPDAFQHWASEWQGLASLGPMGPA